MKNKKGKLHRSVIPFLFICPVIVMNLIFFCLPFLQSLAMSFFEWPLLGEKTFVGGRSVPDVVTLYNEVYTVCHTGTVSHGVYSCSSD